MLLANIRVSGREPAQNPRRFITVVRITSVTRGKVDPEISNEARVARAGLREEKSLFGGAVGSRRGRKGIIYLPGRMSLHPQGFK